MGLSTGALTGAILICGAEPRSLILFLLQDLFLPIFDSEWKLGAILFTLLLGGFVALLEAGGGLQSLLRKILGKGRQSRKRTQLAISGFGLAVFFDGLANSMLVGRVMRSVSDRSGVSRVKLAYLADTTSSAVACLAFISTWIAFQLSMIREGYQIAGQDVDPYRLFFLSLPANYYCWFALCLVLVCILRNFNPGSMGRHEFEAAQQEITPEAQDNHDSSASAHWLGAVIPLLVLIFSVPVNAYIIGADQLFPITATRFAEAYAQAERYVPQIMVLGAILAAASAAIARRIALHKASPDSSREPKSTLRVFLSGIRDLAQPVTILLAAWMLGSVVSQLGAASFLSTLLDGRLPIELFPVAIFLTGALISFSTGTSWGTMGVLMPLAIPVAFSISGDGSPELAEELVVAAIAAVFSGAVFGDHCSPFSDTTIVSSIAAGVDPIDHVKTQLPFALIAALAAIFIGFIPLGYGVSAPLLIAVGLTALFLLPSLPIFKEGGFGSEVQEST